MCESAQRTEVHIETKTQVETAPRMPSPAAVQQLMMRWGAEKMRVSGTLAALRAAEHVEKDEVGEPAEHVDKAPKVVFNWPPGRDVEKTKHVAVRFTYSVIPEGRAAAEHVEKDGTGAAEHVEKDETGAAAEHVEKKSRK